VLYTPFRAGRSWKLAASGYLSAVAAVFLPWPLLFLAAIPFFHKQTGMPAMFMPILVAVVSVSLLVYLVLFYLLSRLRFAFFDVVLNRGEFIAPAWRKHGSASRKWTIFKVILGTALLAVISLPTAAVVHHGIAGFAESFKSVVNTPKGQPPTPQAMQTIFAFYSAFFGIYLIVAIFIWLSSILSDFIVPSLALEDTTLSESFRRLWLFIRNETGQFIGYALLKPVLWLVGIMAAGICFYVVLLAVVIVAVILGGVVGLLLHLLHVPTAVLIVLAAVVGGSVYFATFFYATFLANGTVMTFLEAYLLYFLSERYPLLGQQLAASTPLTVMALPHLAVAYPSYTITPPTGTP
jgi:hypothetical protein